MIVWKVIDRPTREFGYTANGCYIDVLIIYEEEVDSNILLGALQCKLFVEVCTGIQSIVELFDVLESVLTIRQSSRADCRKA
jgi:hypothetical protein